MANALNSAGNSIDTLVIMYDIYSIDENQIQNILETKARMVWANSWGVRVVGMG
jgi:hypothetical protein